MGRQCWDLFLVFSCVTMLQILTFLCVDLSLQVNVGFSHHSVNLGTGTIQPEKRLCFSLDPPREDEPAKKKRKKESKRRRRSAASGLNHGSVLSSFGSSMLASAVSAVGLCCVLWEQGGCEEIG